MYYVYLYAFKEVSLGHNCVVYYVHNCVKHFKPLDSSIKLSLINMKYIA